MALSTVASLIFRLGADTADFTTDMGRAAKQAEAAGRQIGESLRETGLAAQVYIGEKLVQAFTWAADSARQAINDFADLADTAQKVGTSVEGLSTLRYAAEQSGVSADQLQSAMTRLAAKVADAAAGGKQAGQLFQQMGVDIRDANGNIKGTDVLLREMATNFKGYANNSQEAALAVEIFGRSGANLLPMLNQGADGIAELEQRARDMGQEISTGAAVAAESLGDNMNDLNKLMKGFINDALKEVLPNLESLTKYLADSGIEARKAGDGSSWFAETIKTSVGIFIAFKTAIQQVGVVFAFLIDLFATGITRNFEMISSFKEALSVYKTLITEGPAAAWRQAVAAQENLTGMVGRNVDELKGKYALLQESLADVSEEGFRQFEAFNNVTRESADAMNDASEAGDKVAPTIQNVASAADEAAKAQREHAKAVREAEKALREAEKEYADYLKRMEDAEAVAVEASQALTEYLRTSDEWLSGVDDATLDYIATLEKLLDIEKKLEAQGRLSADAQRDLARARENAAQIRDTRQNQAAGVFGGGVNNLEEVFANAVRAAFNERNLASFFRGLKESFKGAFSRRSGEGLGGFIERSGNAILQGVDFAQRAISAFESGDTALQSVVNVLMMIPGPIGIIAGIVNGINAIAGGRLLGTGYERDSASRTINFGPGGAGGQDSIVDVRQRSFFRGRQWRETIMPLDADTQRTLNQLFKQVGQGVAAAAEMLGVETTNLVSGAFKQEFDKDGNLIKEFGTILGRTYNEGFEQFSQRIQAENLLAVLNNAFPSDGILEIADRWRDDAEELLAGTSALLAIGGEIKAGTSLFEGSMRDVLAVLEEFGNPGENLLQTYQRLTQTINAYAQSVAQVQEELLTANLSAFSRSVLQVRRQELNRIAVLNQLAQSTGLVGAREQDLAAVRAASAARIQVLIAELTMDARDLVRQLYQATPGVADAVDPLPGALDSAADAMQAFRQSVQDFIKGLEIDEQLSPFGAMERLQRARAMLREAAGRGDLQSAQQLASATLNIGRDLFASGRDYTRLFEEVQGIIAGVQFRAPTVAEPITTPTRPQVPEDAGNRVRLARELAQSVADLAAERDMSFEQIAAELGFNLSSLATDLGLSQEGLVSYLESLQADTVDLAQVLTDLPRNIARELAALLQGSIPTEPVVGPGSGGTIPGTGPGGPGTGPGGGLNPRDDIIDPIGPGGREPIGPFDRYAEGMQAMAAKLDVLITETRAGNRSNEEALQPIYDELQSQRFLMEDSMSANRSVR